MIVPRNRLIAATALVGAGAGLAAALVPGAVVPSLCACAGLALLAVLDAVAAPGRLARVSARFSVPGEEGPEEGNGAVPVFRLSKDRPGSVRVRLENNGAARSLRLGIAFPSAFPGVEETVRVDVARDATFHFEWPCTPARRGRFSLEGIHVETATPLKLWDVRVRADVAAEVRVYPNLEGERRQLAAIFLNRGATGLHAQRRAGKGRDFEMLREYVAGDPYEDIHWKATARRAYPVTKLHQVERTQEVYVILDASRLSGRADALPDGRETTQLDRFIKASLTLALVAEKQGDLFGLAAFSDTSQALVRARNGRAHYNACRDALYTLEARPVSPDYEEIFTFLRLRLRRRALLIFLTNLDDPVISETFDKHIGLLANRHLVLVNMIAPPYMRPLFSGEAATCTDDVYRALGGHLEWRGLRTLEKNLRRRGVTLRTTTGEALLPDIVSQYLNVKQRQLL